MNEKKLRHIGYLTGVFAGVSVGIGLFIQIVLRTVLAGGGAVQFTGLGVVDVLQVVLTFAVMGAALGAVVGALTKPEEPKDTASGGKGDADDAANETLAKLGIPTDAKPDK